MSQALLCDGVRTPIARSGGPLSTLGAGDLAALVLRGLALRRPAVDWGALDDLVLGCASQEGLWDLARSAALRVALPAAEPALIHRSSGSGLEAVSVAARAIKAGEAELVVAVGADWSPVRPGEAAPAARPVAALDVARGDQDRFALRSQQRWARALAAGRFRDEVMAVPLGDRPGAPQFDTDEPPRPETTLESLGRLPVLGAPAHGVTAGNSAGPGPHDGACALVLASERAALREGLVPLARVVAATTASARAGAPRPGVAPAVQRLLERAGIWLQDVSVIELDEAYASEALVILRELRLPDDAEHVNPNGGAIAMGDPASMSGPRLVLAAARELRRRRGRYALCAMATRAGRGLAMLLERV